MLQVGYNYAPQWEEEPAPVSSRAGRMVKKVTKKKVNSRKKLLGKIGIALFLYGLLLVFLCIKSATLGYQIVSLEKDISNLQTANHRIEYQIAQKTSLQRVAEVAQNELNMYKPNSNINVAVLNTYDSSSQDSSNTASLSEEISKADVNGSSLEKLYASLMQLADNN
ncbi:hypothetical protein ASZ90_018989 [hydrocarbon metagenome]|uniref:Cell division protein ftsl n=1 Tax=hydrocarbon metagenome TaxID=938273 RepID=A0A0W8E4J6_9ZZZZ